MPTQSQWNQCRNLLQPIHKKLPVGWWYFLAGGLTDWQAWQMLVSIFSWLRHAWSSCRSALGCSSSLSKSSLFAAVCCSSTSSAATMSSLCLVSSRMSCQPASASSGIAASGWWLMVWLDAYRHLCCNNIVTSRQDIAGHEQDVCRKSRTTRSSLEQTMTKTSASTSTTFFPLSTTSYTCHSRSISNTVWFHIISAVTRTSWQC